MSTADEWDLTVPEDDAELIAELRRHGVSPGRHLRMSITPDNGPAETNPRAAGADRRRLSFTAAIHAETDLSENADRYLRGFGQS